MQTLRRSSASLPPLLGPARPLWKALTRETTGGIEGRTGQYDRRKPGPHSGCAVASIRGVARAASAPPTKPPRPTESRSTAPSNACLPDEQKSDFSGFLCDWGMPSCSLESNLESKVCKTRCRLAAIRLRAVSPVRGCRDARLRRGMARLGCGMSEEARRPERHRLLTDHPATA
jgi:hypothetical protein